MPLNQSLRKNSHILWAISLIQDKDPVAQTKTEFSEMVADVITIESIESITLCLADRLQRFRLMIESGLSEEDAIKECDQMAKAWHQDNAVPLEKLRETKKLSLLTWEEFLAWEDRASTIQLLENWYKENREFRNDVDGRIRQALQGISSDAKLTDPVQQTTLLKKYLFEECAFQKFAAMKGFRYELYKTPTSKAMRRVKTNSEFVPPGYMAEVYFTQFSPPAKKQRSPLKYALMPPSEDNSHSLPLSETHSSPIFSKENGSFAPIFANPCQKATTKHQKPMQLNSPTVFFDPVKPPGQKAAEFIEKAIQLLPHEQQDEAAKKLVDFTMQNIIAVYYLNGLNNFKI